MIEHPRVSWARFRKGAALHPIATHLKHLPREDGRPDNTENMTHHTIVLENETTHQLSVTQTSTTELHLRRLR